MLARSTLQSHPGAGLRPAHYPHLEKNAPSLISWFEIVSENYMETAGRPRAMLEFIRSRFPMAMHGVGLNLGSAEGIDPDYLKRLKELMAVVQPFVYSDHLCWSATGKHYSHDLLPFPLTKDSLRRLGDNISRVQDYMGREMAIENISHYFRFQQNEFGENDFLLELTKRTGAKLLLDINNVYVSATNLGFDPYAFLDSIPADAVAQIHLAGFSDIGPILFDTHSRPVFDKVWLLFSHFIKRVPQVPFMIEWDEEIPDFATMEDEVVKAQAIWEEHHGAKEAAEDGTIRHPATLSQTTSDAEGGITY